MLLIHPVEADSAWHDLCKLVSELLLVHPVGVEAVWHTLWQLDPCNWGVAEGLGIVTDQLALSCLLIVDICQDVAIVLTCTMHVGPIILAQGGTMKDLSIVLTARQHALKIQALSTSK